MSTYRDESGESLVEVLVTVAILGLAVASLVTGIGAAARMSTDGRRDAEALVVATRAAEAVKSVTDLSCAALSPATFDAALSGLHDLPPGWATADVSVTDASCTAEDGVTIPFVTVRASSPDGAAATSLVVVPRLP